MNCKYIGYYAMQILSLGKHFSEVYMHIVTYLPFEWSIGLSIYTISGEL